MLIPFLRRSLAVALVALFALVPRPLRADPAGDPDLEDESGAAASAPERDATPPKARIVRNLRYASREGVDANLLSLDAFGPAEGEGCPVMVFVHGGGWRGGDKANGGPTKPRHFVGAGWVYVSVNYRLSPDARHPAHVEDVAAAIAFVHAHAATWGGDPERIHVMGHSAGAHLAALVATDERWLKAQGLGLDVIKGVVLLDGAGYDIPTLLKQPRELQRRMYESAFGSDPEGWKDASPLAHVAAGKDIPPFLILPIAVREESIAQSKALAAALEHAGVRAEVKPAPGKTHGTLNSQFGTEGDEPTRQAMEFLGTLRDM